LGVGADNPTLEKLLSRNLKKQKASEEGQGPRRAVKSLMMMMMMMMMDKVALGQVYP
jgi:hypothetical protein